MIVAAARVRMRARRRAVAVAMAMAMAVTAVTSRAIVISMCVHGKVGHNQSRGGGHR